MEWEINLKLFTCKIIVIREIILSSFVAGSRGGTPRGRGGRGGTPRGGTRGGANSIPIGTGGTGANKKTSFDD